MVTRTDYSDDLVSAARSVLLELGHLLDAYREHMAVVGGWVPELLLPAAPIRPVGTLDVDVALNHRTLHEASYNTIHELLISRGYYQKPKHWPYQYFRRVTLQNREIEVRVDFLAGQYEGTGGKHEHQKVLDMRPLKARGCDLVFEQSSELRISGQLPDGSVDSTLVRIADIPSFIVMKGMALDGRMKEKDAWDIYRCIVNYPGGSEALAEALRPRLHNHLVQEGLGKIADKFASLDHYGPKAVADFEDPIHPEAHAIAQRDAYEQVHSLLEKVGLA